MRRLPQLTKMVLSSLILVPALQLLVAPASQAAIVSRGLIARWDAKNPASYPGSGSTWYDLSSNHYNATLYNGGSTTGGPTTSAKTQVNGQKSPTMVFGNQNISSDGTAGKYGALAAGITFDTFTALSVTFTANWETSTGNGWDRIIDFGNGSTSDNLLVARNATSNTLTLELWSGASSLGRCEDTSGITNGVWTHYAIVVDHSLSTCKIYINGSVHATVNSYTALPTYKTRNNNYIGRSNWGTDSAYSGEITDLALYNATLSDTEVAQNYTEQTSAQVLSITSTPPNPVIQGVSSYTFTDTSTSQLLPVRTIDSGSTSVCSLTGNTVNFLGAGTCKINSTQPGNTNYSAAASISQSFTVNANTSLSFTFSGNATYRQITSLSATVAPVTGRITFYAQGKAIPGCKNVLVSSSPYVCSWKPSQHNSVTITATYDPTASGYSTVNSNPTAIRVVPRSGTR